MTSLNRHRARALVSCGVDGLASGAALAVYELPARSRARAAGYGALGLVVAADVLLAELPTVRRALRGLPVARVTDAELSWWQRYAAVQAVWSLLLTVTRRPLARALAARGHRRPHLLLGCVAGVLGSAVTLPAWWQRAEAAEAAEAAEQSAP